MYRLDVELVGRHQETAQACSVVVALQKIDGSLSFIPFLCILSIC